MITIDTSVFREAAIHFQKFGRYDDGPEGSEEFYHYWDREIDRCLNGHTVGEYKITGRYYFYLNYCPIIIRKELSGIKSLDELAMVAAENIQDFPSFWDLDWMYYTVINIARYGIKIEDYKKLPFDLNLNLEPHNLTGGKHLVWLKGKGCGAEQPHSEIVMIKDGQKTMGQVVVGDILYDAKGKETKVLEVLPQGYKDIYTVHFIDGRKVRCGENHLWTVILYGKKTVTLTTRQLIDSGLCLPHKKTGQKTYKYKVPKIEPVQYEEKDLPIHPYIVGAMLGNGAITHSGLRVATEDYELLDRFRDILGEDYKFTRDYTTCNYQIGVVDKFKFSDTDKYEKSQYGVNPLKREFDKLGLIVNCKDKFIPDVYKHCSIEQRMELVRGLLDTDGCISEKGSIQFTNTSEQLIDDLAYVIRSLGIYCKKGIDNRTGESFKMKHRDGREYTSVRNECFKLFISTNLDVFSVSRKLNRINKTKWRRQDVAIVNIEKSNIQELQSCIIVDNPEHLYLTTDFIPTHNSFKAGAGAAYNYHLWRKSATFLVASDTQFLNKDGVFSKFLDYRDFINTHAKGLRKDSDYKKDRVKMHFRASYEEGGIEKGYKSEVMGITLHDDYDKIRGKRGDVYYEEAGKFPNLERGWRVSRTAVEEDNKVGGMLMAFGTGGTEGADFQALEKIFYDPLGYNCLAFNNVYDEGMSDSLCGFFTPSYLAIGFKDKNGNSDTDKAKRFYDKQRELAGRSPDANMLLQAKAEKPYSPSEATLNTIQNIFPIAELTHWQLEVEKKHINIGVPGTLSDSSGSFKFSPDHSLKPILTYPADRSLKDLSGAIVQYESPFRVEGKIPDNMYLIVVDTYRHDTAIGGSLGACYVLMNTNNMVYHRGNKIVASYIGRPPLQEDFNKQVFALAEYYNGKIGFENDEPGGIVDYAKRYKKMYRLHEEFELAYDERLKGSSVKRGFGMHMTPERINQGDIYIKQWLLTPRFTTEDGEVRYNYHTIYDPALLKEFIRYNPKGNFDRISAFRIGMYQLKEMEYKQLIPTKVSDSKSLFFKYKLYQD